MSRLASRVLFLPVLLVAVVGDAWAQEPADGGPTLAQKIRNPIEAVTNLQAALSFGFGAGSDRHTEPALNFQPRIPLGGTENWHVVSRSNLTILHVDSPDETTGLSDLDVSLFLTPVWTEKWVWGVGPIVQFPTATDRALGTGKWSAGPTGALLYVDGPWLNGVLASHLWSFAGPHTRDDVSLTQIDVLLSYTFPSDWYVQTFPNMSYDWRAAHGEGWTIPVGADVGKTFKVRMLGIRADGVGLQIGAYYNVKRPSGTAEWTLQTQISWVY